MFGLILDTASGVTRDAFRPRAQLVAENANLFAVPCGSGRQHIEPNTLYSKGIRKSRDCSTLQTGRHMTVSLKRRGRIPVSKPFLYDLQRRLRLQEDHGMRMPDLMQRPRRHARSRNDLGKHACADTVLVDRSTCGRREHEVVEFRPSNLAEVSGAGHVATRRGSEASSDTGPVSRCEAGLLTP